MTKLTFRVCTNNAYYFIAYKKYIAQPFPKKEKMSEDRFDDV